MKYLLILCALWIAPYSFADKDTDDTVERIENEVKLLGKKIRAAADRVEKAFKDEPKEKKKEKPSKAEIDKLADEVQLLADKVRALGKDSK